MFKNALQQRNAFLLYYHHPFSKTLVKYEIYFALFITLCKIAMAELFRRGKYLICNFNNRYLLIFRFFLQIELKYVFHT